MLHHSSIPVVDPINLYISSDVLFLAPKTKPPGNEVSFFVFNDKTLYDEVMAQTKEEMVVAEADTKLIENLADFNGKTN